MDVPWPFPKLPNGAWSRKSRVAIISVALASKLWSEWLNKVKIHNEEIMHNALDSRPKDTPLITVSNHYSCVDDPVLWVKLYEKKQNPLHLGTLRWRHGNNLRWCPTAADVCFTKPWHATFFSLGRCVPVIRGEGVYQKGMDFLLERLNEGAWVHVFPEGKVNAAHDVMRLKWGVGRLIAECKKVPMVIPMFHLGMDSVLPNKTPYIPRVGQNVTVVYGTPLDLTELVAKIKALKFSPMEQRKAITDRIQEEFAVMRILAEKLHYGTSET